MLKDKRFSVSLVLSLLLHALILFELDLNLFSSQEAQETQNNKPIPIEIVQEEPPNKNTEFLEQEMTAGIFHCPNSYVGVGFTYSIFSNEILDIAPFSPAEKMGIRIGDIIVSMTNNAGASVGDVFSITLNRNYEIITLEAKMEDICTKN